MQLSRIYEEGEKELRTKEIGILLDGVETEFVLRNNRAVLDRYTFRQQCIDGVEPRTHCRVLGIDLATPVIMSAMTMPIPAITEGGLVTVAEGLKEAGSLMWTGTPIPQNLREILDTGVPLAANVKPFRERRRIFEALEEIQKVGVHWVGVEIDAGQGPKVGDRQMASDCLPLSSAELREIREAISVPAIFKGVLSRRDAEKSIEAGADGIMVSNHGGHTLDYLPHPFQVMDDILQAARGKVAILVDGGFRRGSDILKGLAFGACLVGVGRPILYGLAAHGKEGVRAVIDEVTGELRRLMSLVGVKDPASVPRDILIQ
jgi:isopentenyl diphosphate isomerase/L-lactate dehydrogenase-like FMN-dependent dehydrogenase